MAAIAVTATANVAAAGVNITASTLTGDQQSMYELLIPAGRANLVLNGDFTSLSYWNFYGTTATNLVGGRLVVDAPAGGGLYDVLIVQNLPVPTTGRYLVQFWAKASVPHNLQFVLGPVLTVALDTTWKLYSFYFDAPANPSAQLWFGLGGGAAFTLTLDSIAIYAVDAPATTNVSTVEAGVRFTVSVAGSITGIRFYKPLGDPQTSRKLTLWNVATATALGTAESANETGEGWISVNLTKPVAVTPGTTYSASYSSLAPGKWTNAASGYPPYNTAVGNLTPTTSATSATIGQLPSVVDATKNTMVDVVYRLTSAVTSVSIGRQDPTGFSQLIRYGEAIPISGGYLVVTDYEAPFDVPLTYTVTQAVPAGSDAGTSTVVVLPSNGLTWLKDPTAPGRNLIIPVITSLTGMTRAAQSGVFTILDRANPVIVSTVRAAMSATLTCHTLTEGQEQQLIALLATGDVLLLSGPASQLGAKYVAVGDVATELVGLVTEPARLWTLPIQVVDRPVGVTSPNNVSRSWRAVRSTYATWGDLAATGKTWQQLLDSGP
jgi:hypothetical protein